MNRKSHNHRLARVIKYNRHRTVTSIRQQNTRLNESNQLYLPQQDDCETRAYIMYNITKHTSHTKPTQTMGATITNESTLQNPRLRTDSIGDHWIGGLDLFYQPNIRPRFWCCKYTIIVQLGRRFPYLPFPS